MDIIKYSKLFETFKPTLMMKGPDLVLFFSIVLHMRCQPSIGAETKLPSFLMKSIFLCHRKQHITFVKNKHFKKLYKFGDGFS